MRRIAAALALAAVLMGGAGCQPAPPRSATASGRGTEPSADDGLTTDAASSGPSEPAGPGGENTAGTAASAGAATGAASSATGEPGGSKGKNTLWRENYETYIAPLLAHEETFVKSGFDRFITRRGDTLYDGNEPFRFLSMNTVNINYVSDDTFHTVSTENRRRTSPYEITDTLKTVVEAGGTVIRFFASTVRRAGEYDDGKLRLIYAPNVYDELLWRDLDRVLAECNRYGVRAVIALIDNWGFLGGMPQFDKLCGGPGTKESFYRRRETIDRFKEYIRYLVNRTNYYTGVRYKDDKAVLCWELGNEITSTNLPASERATDKWQLEIAAYLKSVDPNHLVMDGGGIGRPTAAVAASPDIDIITYHYDAPFSIEGKPTVLGEFSPVYLSRAYIDSVMEKSVGMMVWSLASHNKNGGFLYRAQDWEPPKAPVAPVRWPGFASGMSEEAVRMSLLADNAYRIRGMARPAVRAPEPPLLLPIPAPDKIRWRGSVGADYYELQRADHPEGPYAVIETGLEDAGTPRFTAYRDRTAGAGRVYYYRLIAVNRGGRSAPSNIIPCMPESLSADMEEETFGRQLVDEFNSLERMHAYSGDIRIVPGPFGDPLAAAASPGAEMVYRLPGSIRDFFLTVSWQDEAYKRVDILLSSDGKTYVGADPALLNYGPREGRSYCGRLERFPLTGEYTYLKIRISGGDGPDTGLFLSRLEINYR